MPKVSKGPPLVTLSCANNESQQHALARKYKSSLFVVTSIGLIEQMSLALLRSMMWSAAINIKGQIVLPSYSHACVVVAQQAAKEAAAPAKKSAGWGRNFYFGLFVCAHSCMFASAVACFACSFFFVSILILICVRARCAGGFENQMSRREAALILGCR
jgi:hypothetical protein